MGRKNEYEYFVSLSIEGKYELLSEKIGAK